MRTWYYDFEASAVLDGGWRRHTFALHYSGQQRYWDTLRQENFFDHQFSGRALLKLHRKLRARLTAGYELGHDRRGELLTRPGTTPGLDEWGAHSLGGEITLGGGSQRPSCDGHTTSPVRAISATISKRETATCATFGSPRAGTPVRDSRW